MAKKVLSIVIGNECTKVCEVTYKKNNKNKGVRVFRSISFSNPANSIEDGFIKDISLFGDELRKQLKAGRLKSDKVIFSIASSKIANREIILPPTREKKIMDIIKTGSSEYFPIDIKDYILSYLILEKNTSTRKMISIQKKLEKKELKHKKQQQKLGRKASKKKSNTEIIAEKMEQMDLGVSELTQAPADTGSEDMSKKKKHMRISVYAVPSILVKNYYNFAKAMRLDIVSLDYSGNSSYQMLRRQGNRGTNVFVQLNEQDTVISILRDDILILQRTVGYGISMLTEAVMEQNYFRVGSKEEALELLSGRNLLTEEADKKESALFDSSWSQGEVAAANEFLVATEALRRLDEQKEQEARRNIIDSLHFLTNSIARMLDYYKANHKNEEINKIYLSGTGVCIRGIDQFFYMETGTLHKKIEKLWTVSAKKKAVLYRKNPSEFITCTGAVINPIDFVPKDFLEKRQKRSAVFATIVFMLACLAGSAGTVYVSYVDYREEQQKLDEANKELAALEDVTAVYSDNEEAKNYLDSLLKFQAVTGSRNDNISAIIKEFENKLPSGTTINTMQFSETGIMMSVTANVTDAGATALIAKFYSQLETIGYFEDVEISDDIKINEEAIPPTASFTITCTYAQ
jgi:type IV pilus assembly protein PilM